LRETFFTRKIVRKTDIPIRGIMNQKQALIPLAALSAWAGR
jgi:hypothetical protein